MKLFIVLFFILIVVLVYVVVTAGKTGGVDRKIIFYGDDNVFRDLIIETSNTAQRITSIPEKCESMINNMSKNFVDEEVMTEPLNLKNVSGSCHLDTSLQLIFVMFKSKAEFEQLEKIGDLYKCNDTKSKINEIRDKYELSKGTDDETFTITRILNKISKISSIWAKIYITTASKNVDVISLRYTNTISISADDTKDNMKKTIEYRFEKYNTSVNGIFMVVTLGSNSGAGDKVNNNIVQLDEFCKISENDYELIGIGVGLSGHAIAYVKYGTQWWKCDDLNDNKKVNFSDINHPCSYSILVLRKLTKRLIIIGDSKETALDMKNVVDASVSRENITVYTSNAESINKISQCLDN